MVRFILISIRIIGGRDWPGVGIGVPICICVYLIFRRQVPILGRGGWLFVKQMDPVNFSAETGNLS